MLEKTLWCNITHREGKRILGLFCIVKIRTYVEETFFFFVSRFSYFWNVDRSSFRGEFSCVFDFHCIDWFVTLFNSFLILYFLLEFMFY